MKIFYAELKRLVLCPFLSGLCFALLAFDLFCLIGDLSPDYYQYGDVYPAIIGDADADENALAYYHELYMADAGIYDSLDMMQIFAGKMKLYYPEISQESAYYQWAEKNYQALQARVEKIRTSDEKGMNFYPGRVYALHTRLGRLLSRSLLSSLLLTAMSILYLMDFDRLNHREGVVYSTRTGRRVQLIKVLASTVLSLFASALLFLLPLAVFTAVVPMRGLWGTSVSAFMLTETKAPFTYPFITWVKMSVREHLFAVLGLCAILVLIVLALCAGIQFMVRNSYLVMLGIAIAFLGLYVFPLAVPAGVVKSLALMSPAILWGSIETWFIEIDPARGPMFEIVTAILWISLGAIMLIVGWKKYKRAEI